MLDVESFHQEFEALFSGLAAPDGYLRLRSRAVALWESNDPIIRSYVEVLRTGTPEEWEAAFDEGQVIEWYRVLMAPYLVPTRAFHAPEQLKRRLPELGLAPSEARRLALGRELELLAEAHASPAVSSRLSLHFTVGAKGWLSQDDIEAALARLRTLDRDAFRGRPDLVPMVENAYEVLEAAAAKTDHVLLIIST